jgi:Ni,Fe-hydrogenase III small subunit/ferredoxin
MFRWIARGLRIGTLTTRFPRQAPEAEALGSPLPGIHPRGPERAEALRGASACPTGAIDVDGDGVTLDLGRCIGCGLCWERAPASFVEGPSYGLAADRRAGLRARARWGVPPEVPARWTRQMPSLWRRSLHVRHVDGGSDGAVEFELAQLNAPQYDLHRLGVFFTSSPRHADALLVTGPVTSAMVEALRATFEAMPAPKLVVAAGADAISGGLWAGSEVTCMGVDAVLPVDVYIPGSPPSPLALIDGLLLASGRRFAALDRRPSLLEVAR